MFNSPCRLAAFGFRVRLVRLMLTQFEIRTSRASVSDFPVKAMAFASKGLQKVWSSSRARLAGPVGEKASFT